MKERLRDIVQSALGFLRWVSGDLGTVFLGAAAIFLVRAFPASVCDECQELDGRMLLACGFFLALGMVFRYVHKTYWENGPD